MSFLSGIFLAIPFLLLEEEREFPPFKDELAVIETLEDEVESLEEEVDELREEVARLEEENSELEAKNSGSASGGVSANAPRQAAERALTVEATAYTAECEGCSGITFSGVDVRNTIYHEGKRIIASDPSVIPTGSNVVIKLNSGESFEATAQDIGGAIVGSRIDVLVDSKEEALNFGRQNAELKILK